MTPAPALHPLYGSRHPPAPHTLRVPQSTLPAVASAREPSACFRFTTAPEPRTRHARPRNLVLANFPVNATQAPFLALFVLFRERPLRREVVHRPRGSAGSSTLRQPHRPHPGAASPYRAPGSAFPRPARSFSHPAATDPSPRAPAPSPYIAFPCRYASAPQRAPRDTLRPAPPSRALAPPAGPRGDPRPALRPSPRLCDRRGATCRAGRRGSRARRRRPARRRLRGTAPRQWLQRRPLQGPRRVPLAGDTFGTGRAPHPLVLSGHAASLTPYSSDTPRPSRRRHFRHRWRPRSA